MSKRIKKLIKKTRHGLTWPVTNTSNDGLLMITSDHRQRRHTINNPPATIANPHRDHEYLHELAHATLCEQVHPQFSTQYFAIGVPDPIVSLIGSASQAASDWFADEFLHALLPEETRAEVEEHLHLVSRALGGNPEGGPDMFTGFALIVAQAIRYCGYKIELSDPLKQAVNGLLSVPPDNPTVEKLQAAINNLLACYCPHRVRLMTDQDGLEVWEVNNP
jgi:hypothetical protein